jgi:hypothetical protein
MKPVTAFELFAAFAAQFPILTREELEATVLVERGGPSWARVMAHAREQAEALGLRFSQEDADRPRPQEATQEQTPVASPAA